MNKELTSEEVERIQKEAFDKAQEIYGDNVVVGRNFNFTNSYHVGVRGLMGIWVKRGVGKSFDEAFNNIMDFPDNDQDIHRMYIRDRVVQMNKVHKNNIVFASKDEKPTLKELDFDKVKLAEKVIAITPYGREVVLKDRKGESN